jgi:hypothetical protein
MIAFKAEVLRYVVDYGWSVGLVLLKTLVLSWTFVNNRVGYTALGILLFFVAEGRSLWRNKPSRRSWSELMTDWKRIGNNLSDGAVVFLYALGIVLAINLLRAPLMVWDDYVQAEIAKANRGPAITKQFGLTYRDTNVVIDGKVFYDCTFENATLVFNGTAPVMFVERNHFIGQNYVDIENNNNLASFVAALAEAQIIPLANLKYVHGSDVDRWMPDKKIGP